VLTVTERAKRELRSILIANEPDLDEGLRLLPFPNGECALTLDTEMAGDHVVEYEGYKVLLVGIEYFKLFDTKTVDCQDTAEGAVLFVK